MTELTADREVIVLQSESYHKAEELLREQCESLWTTLIQLQAKLLNVRRQHQDPVSSDDSPTLGIYLAMRKRLLAQIAVMQNAQPSKLPDNEVIKYECIKDEVKKSVAELQDLLALVKSEQKELESEIKKEEQFRDEVEQVQSVLREKLNQAVKQHQACDNSTLISEMNQKEMTLNKHCKMLMKNLAEFVQEHFPEPNESQLAKWRKQHTASSDDSTLSDVTVLPLITILQALLNQCIDSPHNAYITIDDSFWPPYIELLIRTGIALRNPQNTQQIRLTPFHL